MQVPSGCNQMLPLKTTWQLLLRKSQAQTKILGKRDKNTLLSWYHEILLSAHLYMLDERNTQQLCRFNGCPAKCITQIAFTEE